MEDYTLSETLGQGWFSSVKLALHKRNGKSVAIKEINYGKKSTAKHLQQEIEAVRKLTHPNIIRIIEVIPSRNKLYSVMEYAAGGNLSEKVIRNGKLRESVARKLFQQLISAVEYSHAQNVYHRDLTPLNLVLDQEGNLKVCNFGLPFLLHQDQRFIMTRIYCGSLHYLAPEILGNLPYDPSKVDIWSCGAILFFLLAGYHPFHDPNSVTSCPKAHIIKKNHTSTRSSVSSLLQVSTIAIDNFRFPSWFSPGACKLLSKILVVDPSARITIPQILKDEWFKLDYCPPKHSDEEHCTSPCNVPLFGRGSMDHITSFYHKVIQMLCGRLRVSEHCFFLCDQVKPVWSWLLSLFHVALTSQHVLLAIYPSTWNSLQQQAFHLASGWLLWSIWKRRWLCIFKGLTLGADQVLHEAQDRLVLLSLLLRKDV